MDVATPRIDSTNRMARRTTAGLARSSGRRYRHAIGAVLALAILALLVWLVGIREVHDAFGRVTPAEAATLILIGFLPIVAWGIALRIVLGGIGEHVGTATAVGLFAAAEFLANVTPMGVVGGDPASGLLVAAVRETTFERGFAAITTLHVVVRATVVALGLVGLGLLAHDVGPIVAGRTPVVVLGTWLVVIGLVLVGWRHRGRIGPWVGSALATIAVRLGEVVPWLDGPSRASVERRVTGFVAAVEVIVSRPERLAAVVPLAALGHLAAAGTLWLTLDVLGVRTSFAALLVVLPLAKLGGLSPTPGGAGSASAVLAGLLILAVGVDPATATVAAVLYRVAAYWVPTLLGGVVALVFLRRYVWW